MTINRLMNDLNYMPHCLYTFNCIEYLASTLNNTDQFYTQRTIHRKIVLRQTMHPLFNIKLETLR